MGEGVDDSPSSWEGGHSPFFWEDGHSPSSWEEEMASLKLSSSSSYFLTSDPEDCPDTVRVLIFFHLLP